MCGSRISRALIHASPCPDSPCSVAAPDADAAADSDDEDLAAFAVDRSPASHYRSPRASGAPAGGRSHVSSGAYKASGADSHGTPRGEKSPFLGGDFDAEVEGPRSPRSPTFDSKREDLERRQAAAARIVASHISTMAGVFPKLTAELYGRGAAEELQNDSSMLSDLDCLPPTSSVP